MKIKYLKTATFNSNGVTFEKDLIVEVSDAVGTELVDTFKGFFEVIAEAPKAKVEVSNDTEEKTKKAPQAPKK
jgi:hypothetical protein